MHKLLAKLPIIIMVDLSSSLLQQSVSQVSEQAQARPARIEPKCLEVPSLKT